MSTKDNNRELGINDMAFTIEVESEVIEGVRHGKITHITLQRESWGHTCEVNPKVWTVKQSKL